MKRLEYPAAIQALVAELKRMPGVGPRSAERIALWMIQSRDARAGEIARAIGAATQTIKPCVRCGFFTTEPVCEICVDPARDTSLICVVEQPTEILPLERTGAFRGRYHSLGERGVVGEPQIAAEPVEGGGHRTDTLAGVAPMRQRGTAVRPDSARLRVSSSACSRPPPAGRPCARRVTFTGSSRRTPAR